MATWGRVSEMQGLGMYASRTVIAVCIAFVSAGTASAQVNWNEMWGEIFPEEGAAKPEPARQPDYPSRWSADGALSAYAWEALAIPCLSMETPYSSSRGLTLTRAEYRRLGAGLLEGICACLDAEPER